MSKVNKSVCVPESNDVLNSQRCRVQSSDTNSLREFEFFKCNFQSFERHAQTSVHLHCTEVEAEISETDSSQPGSQNHSHGWIASGVIKFIFHDYSDLTL